MSIRATPSSLFDIKAKESGGEGAANSGGGGGRTVKPLQCECEAGESAHTHYKAMDAWSYTEQVIF